MTDRFAGTISPFLELDASSLTDWLVAIPRDEWHRMTDETWHDWGAKFRPLAENIVAEFFPGCTVSGVALFMIEPGAVQRVHVDEMQPGHVVRVHIPIFTNPHAVMTFDDGPLHMKVGIAYKFNTQAPHSLYNGGKLPRVHFVFDVTSPTG